VSETFRHAFDYSGRSRRREYWTFALATFVAVSAVEWIELKLGLATVGPRGVESGLLGSVVTITFLTPGLAVAVRRLHDSNRAGWWLALPAAPVLFWVAALATGFGTPAMFPAMVVAIAACLLVVLVLMCFPGTRGANRFGPDPRAPNLAEIFS
jgi:uncharacterized membrane protein YhaH (DUF805 family)